MRSNPPSRDPRENLIDNVVQRHFAFDVREGTVVEGLNFKLEVTRQCCS